MALARYTFPNGLREVQLGWTTETFIGMLLLGTWSPDPSFEVVVDDVVAHELTNGSYSRETVTSPATSISLPPTSSGVGSIAFECDDLDFGIISGGEVAAWLAIFYDLGADADSLLAGAYLINYEADGVTTALIDFSGGAAFVSNTACPADYS